MLNSAYDNYGTDVPLDESARTILKWKGIAKEADDILSDCFVSLGLTDDQVELLDKAHKNVCTVRRVLTQLELRHRRLTND